MIMMEFSYEIKKTTISSKYAIFVEVLVNKLLHMHSGTDEWV